MKKLLRINKSFDFETINKNDKSSLNNQSLLTENSNFSPVKNNTRIKSTIFINKKTDNSELTKYKKNTPLTNDTSDINISQINMFESSTFFNRNESFSEIGK